MPQKRRIPASVLNKMQFQEQSSMCAKAHAIYRNARNGPAKMSGFSPKSAIFSRKQGHFDSKKAANCMDSGSRNRSKSSLRGQHANHLKAGWSRARAAGHLCEGF
jgi:hypothetical protein